jgi:hypothetical protein
MPDPQTDDGGGCAGVHADGEERPEGTAGRNGWKERLEGTAGKNGCKERL